MPSDEERRRSAQFLQTLYDEVDGSVIRWTDPEPVGVRIGHEFEPEASLLVDYLVSSGLVEQTHDGQVRLTNAGAREAQQLRSASAWPAGQFPLETDRSATAYAGTSAMGQAAGAAGSGSVEGIGPAALNNDDRLNTSDLQNPLANEVDGREDGQLLRARIQRLLSSPWMVTIVGGLVVAIVGGLVVAILSGLIFAAPSHSHTPAAGIVPPGYYVDGRPGTPHWFILLSTGPVLQFGFVI